MKERRINRINPEYIIITIFLLISCTISLWIIARDKTELNSDNHNYFAKSIKLYQELDNPKDFIYQILYEPELAKPPGFMLSSLPFFIFFGLSTDIARTVNVVYYILTIIAVYMLGEAISKKAGFYGAIISIFIPQMIFSSRNYMIDMSICAITLFSIYAYIKSNSFKDRRYSLLFAALFNIGLMFRTTYLLYLLPWLFTDIKKLTKEFLRKGDARNNMLIIALMIFFISGPWHVTNLDKLRQYYTEQIIWNAEANRMFYFNQIKNFSLGKLAAPFALVIFLVFAALSKNRYKWNIISSILIPFIMLNLSPIKNISHMLGILPFISLGIAIGLIRINSRYLTAAAVFLMLLQFILIQFSFYPSLEDNPNKHFYLIKPEQDFEYDDFTKNLMKEAPPGKKITIALINDLPLFPTRYKLRMMNNTDIWFAIPTQDSRLNESGLEKAFLDFDYAIYFDIKDQALPIREYTVRDEFGKNYQIEKMQVDFLIRNIGKFKPVGSFYSAYYGLNYTLYKNNMT